MTLEAGQPVLKVNLRKLKQRLIDTDELIGLYSTARSREDFLEQSVLQERRAKMAAEAAIAESESRCRTALRTVREREEDMAVLRQTVCEREAEATALRQTVRDREAVATALRKTIREREAEATALRQRLSSLEAEMKEALNAEKDTRLAAQPDAATPLTSVVIQPSGVGAASIEVLQKLLSERGDDWMREWLSGLARAIVGTDRCLPLAPPSLQRAVLACHLFASCCRERGDMKRCVATGSALEGLRRTYGVA
ncbi:hypothetical protein Ctob_001583 [Chrysochromulina tobinii]|uniref:Uncharacterized protein n=1 Tax=Chrysochromulina tobinii TaxID=1460289 RepID=A0A0M0JCT9_9EUKA|nr:hypothetical protein Ctob_001583 [Chrysochromulina tobinii]|eukprot:KOO24018.1 hypothetical protein Ctob_001583 [Chrysochromulina sp. CCMP291]